MSKPLTMGTLRKRIVDLERRERYLAAIVGANALNSPNAQQRAEGELSAIRDAIRILRVVRDAKLLDGILASELAIEVHRG